MPSIIIMLIPTTVGAISVVWNLTGRARDHEILARRFYQIAKINQCRGSRPRTNRELAHRNSWRVSRGAGRFLRTERGVLQRGYTSSRLW